MKINIEDLLLSYLSVLLIYKFHEVLLMLLHRPKCGIFLLFLFKHPEHLFFCGCELIFEILIFPLHPEHPLRYLLGRVSDHLVHINYGLDVFGFGAEVQGLLGLLIVLVQLTHGADDGGH